jgi:glycosyltransferase involved in cell wall biosynthesis
VDCLEKLLDDETLSARFSRQGRLTVEEKYSLKAHAPRLANVLEEAANGGAK